MIIETKDRRLHKHIAHRASRIVQVRKFMGNKAQASAGMSRSDEYPYKEGDFIFLWKNTHRWNSHEYQNARDTTISPRGDQIYQCYGAD